MIGTKPGAFVETRAISGCGALMWYGLAPLPGCSPLNLLLCQRLWLLSTGSAQFPRDWAWSVRTVQLPAPCANQKEAPGEFVAWVYKNLHQDRISSCPLVLLLVNMCVLLGSPML